MKILYVTTIGSTMDFFRSFVKQLIEEGHTVDIATNENASKVPEFFKDLGCKVYPIDCSRSIFSRGNLKAIKQIKNIVKENGYEMVHCHTPVAAMCTRLACKKLRKKNGLKVFYTAHGFHFYKGAPKKNWLMFYPVEKYCSRFTDVLITINKEDFETAKRKLKAKTVEYVPGVGIDTKKIGEVNIDVAKKRAEIGVPLDAFLLLSVGELNQNKNHITVINALKEIKDKNIYYVIVGKGNKKDELLKTIKELGLEDRVKLLGFRTDVFELYKASNVFVHPSFREGLPVSIMEAMASSLPIIASKIRGCRDLVDEFGGILCNPFDYLTFKDAIINVKDKCVPFSEYNLKKIVAFDQEEVNQSLSKIYKGVISNGKANV